MKLTRIRIMALLVLQTGIFSQQTPVESSADAAAAWLPLGEGARWTWRMSHTPGSVVERSAEAVKPADLRGARCWEFREVNGEYRQWGYEGTKPDGVYVWRNAYLGGMRGIDRTTPPRRVLACPPKAGFVWEWSEEGSVQTSGDAEPPPAEELRSRLRAGIETLDDPVTVPAGAFRAVRVRMTSASRYFGDNEEISWWVAGTGLVKRVVRSTSGEPWSSVQELVSFNPPHPDTGPTPEAALATSLGSPPKCPCGSIITCPEWISDERITDWFRSRFCVLSCGAQTHLVRVRQGIVTPFDPKDIGTWQRLVAEEQINLKPVRSGADDGPAAIAAAAALLAAWAADPGFVPQAGVNSTHTTGARDWKVEASIPGRAADGSRRIARARLSGAGERIQTLVTDQAAR